MGMPAAISPFGVAFGSSKSNDGILERFFSGWESAFCAPRSVETLSKELVEEPDVLDYVFESVQSFACTEASLESNDYFSTPHQRQSGHSKFREDDSRSKGSSHLGSKGSFDLSLRRENSMLEVGPNGTPAYLSTTRRTPGRLAKPGEEGDLLDYCFEHVESLVCTEGKEVGDDEPKGGWKPANRTPMRNTTNQHHRNNSSQESSSIPREISTQRRKKKRRNAHQKQNYYPDEEDNILLYYRPMKTD